MQLLPQPRTGESAAGVKVGLCALLSDVAGPVLVPFVLDQHKVSHVKMASVEQRLPATVHDNVAEDLVIECDWRWEDGCSSSQRRGRRMQYDE